MQVHASEEVLGCSAVLNYLGKSKRSLLGVDFSALHIDRCKRPNSFRYGDQRTPM